MTGHEGTKTSSAILSLNAGDIVSLKNFDCNTTINIGSCLIPSGGVVANLSIVAITI